MEAAFALDGCDPTCLTRVSAARAHTGNDIRSPVDDTVASHFGEGQPAQSMQWLSDNENMYTAHEMETA